MHGTTGLIRRLATSMLLVSAARVAAAQGVDGARARQQGMAAASDDATLRLTDACAAAAHSSSAVVIDVSSGSADVLGSTHFDRVGSARVLICGMNPFRYAYRVGTSETTTPPDAAPLVGTPFPVPSAGESKPAGDSAKKAPAADSTARAKLLPTSHFRASSLGMRALAAPNAPNVKGRPVCPTDAATRMAWLEDANEIFDARDSLTSEQTREVRLQKQFDARADSLRTLVEAPTTSGRRLYLSASEIVVRRQDAAAQLEAYLSGRRKLIGDLNASARKWAQTYAAVQTGLSGCDAPVQTALSDLEKSITHVTSEDVPALDSTTTTLESRIGPLRDQAQFYQDVLSDPRQFVRSDARRGEPYDNTTITLKIEREDKLAAKPSFEKADSPALVFAQRSRWSISAGPSCPAHAPPRARPLASLAAPQQ